MKTVLLLVCLFLSFGASAQEGDSTPLFRGGDGAEVNLLSDYEAGVRMANAGELEMAVQAFTQGAEKGDPRAMFALGSHYLFGDGVARDPAAAQRWLEAAVAKGDVNATFMLALMYSRGDGVAVDQAKAQSLLLSGATRCLVYSQHELGRRLRDGDKVERDPAAAAAWLTLAGDDDTDTGAEARSALAELEPTLTADERERARLMVAGLRPTLRCPE